MLHTLSVTAPDVDPAKLIATGVSEIRDAFPAEQIPGILLAYMDGLRIPFAIATAAAGAACILACVEAAVPTRVGKKSGGGGGGGGSGGSLESSDGSSEGVKDERPPSR